MLVNTGWWSSSKKACNTECGFGGVGPLSCDKGPLDAETFMKPSGADHKEEHWTRNLPKGDGRNIMMNQGLSCMKAVIPKEHWLDGTLNY